MNRRIGRPLVFGLTKPGQINPLSYGRIYKLRFRASEPAIAYVKNGNKITQHWIEWDDAVSEGGNAHLMQPIGENLTLSK